MYWNEPAYPFHLTAKQLRRRRVHWLTISGRGFALEEKQKDSGDFGREFTAIIGEMPEYGPQDYTEARVAWRSRYEYDPQGRLLQAEWQDSLLTGHLVPGVMENSRRAQFRYDAAGRLMESRFAVDCQRCEVSPASARFSNLTPLHQRDYYDYAPNGQLRRLLTKGYMVREVYNAPDFRPDSSIRQPYYQDADPRLLYFPYWTKELYRYDAAGRLTSKATYATVGDSLFRGASRLTGSWHGTYNARGQLVREVIADGPDLFTPFGFLELDTTTFGLWYTEVREVEYRGRRRVAERRQRQYFRNSLPSFPLDTALLRQGVLRLPLHDSTARIGTSGRSILDSLRYGRRGRLLTRSQTNSQQYRQFVARWQYQGHRQQLDYYDFAPVYHLLQRNWRGQVREEMLVALREKSLALKLPPEPITPATSDSLLPLNTLLHWRGSNVFRWQFDYRGGLLRRAELRTAYNRSNYRRQPQDTVDARVARLLLLPAPGRLSQQVQQVRRRWPDWPANTYANRLFNRFEYEFYPR
ncbi:hypothetical protein DLM85_22115 [Hymenobacter edaphi]|uniref:RHS repeat protein n=1 Tax=Hymenobacter edaphi TaxID=2211146 RepID=A0A328B7L7_9BACT|nr:hypothetical protein DLM85_22115 [Hymenobacter edaphi]